MRKKYSSEPVKDSEITPESLYLSRREFLKTIGILGAGALISAACASPTTPTETSTSTATAPGSTMAPPTGTAIPSNTPTLQPSATQTATATSEPEPEDKLTSYQNITTFNNFYEFTTNKEAVAGMASRFRISPWQVEVGGLVQRPRTYSIEELREGFTQEERVYRMRCVEGWSMVIPWLGFRLADLLNEVEPTSAARYVRFESPFDPELFPGQKDTYYDWPYTEGLRLDEAMHDLTIIATGLYGKVMPRQNGAPLRLIVPWKYGFKSIKSIVKIELVAEQPATLWSTANPKEYGFYSNVNPEVSHPRWSQAREWRLGEIKPRDTLMFNGYAEEVAHLYEGMDLSVDF